MSLAHARVDTLHSAPETAPPPPSRRPKRRVDPAITVSVLAVVVLFAALAHVWQKAELASLTYELHQANARLGELKRVQTQLLVEVERARSLGRVEAEARLRLGMVRPDSSQWVVVASGPREPQAVATAASRSGWSIFSAVAEWYDQVSASVRAALPQTPWSRAGR